METPGGAPAARTGEGLGDQLRDLRDHVRRLQEQVDALAAGHREGDERLSTHIEGLDAVLGGGLPRGHVIALHGPTGAMKTSLALYMMAKNRAAGRRGVFVSIEEGRDSILRTMRGLGLGDAEDFVVDIGRLRLEHAGAEDVRDWVEVLRDYLVRRREREPLSLVVIDSFNALADLAHFRSPRRDVFHFVDFLRSTGMTTLVVVERSGEEADAEDDLDRLADGVLELRYSGAGEGRVHLLLRCVKMRHALHSRDYFVLAYEGGAFSIRPYGGASRSRWSRSG